MIRYDPVAHGAHCHVCPLKGNVVVPPAPARSRLKLVIVGEGPGRVEERQKEPFVGPSGKFLDQLLGDFSPSRKNIHVTNATMCRGELENDMKTAEVCCAPRLLKELAALDPAVPIVAMGKAAAKSILGTRSILMARGFVWKVRPVALSDVKTSKSLYVRSKGYEKIVKGKKRRVPPASFEVQIKLRLKWLVLKWRRRLQGRTVLPTIHPAFVMRSDTWKPILQIDMRRALRIARGERLRLWDTGPYDLIRSAKEFRAWSRGVGPRVGCDIETRGIVPMEAVMLCVGISDGEKTVVVDPRRESGEEPTWGPVLVGVMQKFLEQREAVVMHNGYNFDQIVMMQHGFVFT